MEKLQKSVRKHRLLTKEYIDEPDFAGEALEKNLSDIKFINRHFGGYHALKIGIDNLMPVSTQSISLVDIGCGSGDMLQFAQKHLTSKYKKQVESYGLDNNPNVLKIAKAQTATYGLKFKEIDVSILQNIPSAHIIMMHLFLHHFSDETIVQYIKTCYTKARIGLIISDLHNAKHNKWLFNIGSVIFNWSYVTKHDGMASINKGFNKKRWQWYLQKAGLKDYTLILLPFGRWLCVIKK